MPMPRGSIEMGPAAVLIGSTYIYFRDGLKLDPGLKTFDVEVEGRGKDSRYDSIMPTLTGTPSGMWTSGLLALLFPQLNQTVGTSIYGASDTALSVLPLNGTSDKITFPAYGVRKMPRLTMSAGKTAFGDMEFGLPVKNNTAWSNAAARFTIASQSSFTDTSFEWASLPTVPYTVSLAGGSAPWDGIVTQGGVEIDFNLGLSPLNSDTDGIIDERYADLQVAVKLTAANATMAQILEKLALQGTGIARGVSMSATGADMTITGGTGNPQVVVTGARLVAGTLNFDLKNYRGGPLNFIMTKSAGTGAAATVGIAA